MLDISLECTVGLYGDGLLPHGIIKWFCNCMCGCMYVSVPWMLDTCINSIEQRMEIKKECQIVCIFFYYLTEEVSRLNFAFIKITKLFWAKSCQRVEGSPNELRQWQMRTTVQWIALDYRTVLQNIYSISLCNSHLYSITFIIRWNRTISNASIKEENWIKKIKKSN